MNSYSKVNKDSLILYWTIMPHQASCAIFCTVSKELIYFKVFDLSEKKILKHTIETNYLYKTKKYSHIYLSFHSRINTIIPKVLMSEAHLMDYLRFEHGNISTKNAIFYDELDKQYFIYAIDDTILDLFGSYIPKATISHLSADFIKSIQKHNQLIIHTYQKGIVEFFAFKNGEIALHNTYHYTSKDDIIYFLSAIIEFVSTDIKKASIHLVGIPIIDIKTLKNIFPSISEIKWLNKELDMQVNKNLKDINLLEHLSLYTLQS